MRLLGYALLVIGFGAINWKTMHARDITLGVTYRHLQRIPQQGSYSRDDVVDAMSHAARDTWDRSTPWFYFRLRLFSLAEFCSILEQVGGELFTLQANNIRELGWV